MKRGKHAFTLIEMIVAMGIFALIMAMVMRVFTGAQSLWRTAENRTATYNDGRAAMDFACRLLENSAALYQGDAGNPSDGYCPINKFSGGTPATTALLLATTEDGHKLQSGSVSNLYYLTIWRDPASDTLKISSIGDAAGTTWSDVVDFADAGSAFNTLRTGGETQEIIPRVVDFRVLPSCHSGTTWQTWTYGNAMPDMVTLEITVMDRNAYKVCRDLNSGLTSGDWDGNKLYGGPLATGETKAKRLAKHSKKFSRTVYLEYQK